MVNINDIRKSKPRSDAKLLNLSEENIQKLRDALIGGMKYSAACEFVAKEFNISVGHSTVGEFWKLSCIPFLEARRANALREARGFNAEAQKRPGCFDQVAQDNLQQTSYSMSLNPHIALAELRVLRGILLKERALAVQEARLKVEERRAELAEHTLKKMEEPESKLSYAEQSAKLREMFGMACASTGRPPKPHPRSSAETIKAGSRDQAAPNPDAASNQTEKPTEP